MNIRHKIEIGIAVLSGVVVGLGGYTFVYAKGYSYLSNDPAACANCHVMRDFHAGWLKSSHRSVAGCNDCHTPHGFVGKYSTKALNGVFHSFAFTSGLFPDTIAIQQRNRRITENACRGCHEDTVLAIDGSHQAQKVSCLRCHATVGHL